jgi:putative ABC transport system permease protein
MQKGWRWWRQRRSGPDPEIDEEIRLHLEGRISEYVAAGMTPQRAEGRARERFGDPKDIAARCRAVRPQAKAAPHKREIMQTILQDLRYAARTLRRSPGYATAVILTLTLTIGATTTVFSVVNGVLLHPLPHPDPEQLVLVYEVDQRPGYYEDHNPVAAANFRDWREQNRVFDAMAGFQTYLATFRGQEDPARVQTGLVSAHFFRILGVNAVLGRTFLPDEDIQGNDNVALLGYDFWVTRFGADSGIVGRSITVDNRSLNVVGVLPDGFRFLDREFGIWSPLALSEEMYQNRRSHIMRVVARMNPAVTLNDAQHDMERVVSGLRDANPEFLTGWNVHVVSLTDQVVGPIRPALMVLMGAVGFVLLIAAVNVANLMLTRTLGEVRETAVRAALGAGRGRVAQQKLVESSLVALTGGGLGAVAAWVGTRSLLAAAPDNIPQLHNVGVDARVLGFTLLISIVVGLLFGLAPSLQASRVDLSTALREGGRGSTDGRAHQRLRSGFAVTQIAFSAILLVGAGLMVVTFGRLMRVDPGFESTGVATMAIAIPESGYPDAASQSAFWSGLLARVRALPGVDRAGVTRFMPLDDTEWTWSVQVAGKPEPSEGEKRDYGWHAVSDDYFAAMGITVGRGRAFTAADRPGSPRVVIINQAMVRRFFDDGESPVGQRMHLRSRPEEVMEIVGVVEDVRHYSLEEEPLPAYFIPYGHIPFTWFISEMNLTVRTAGDPDAVVPALRNAIREAEQQAVVTDVISMPDRVARSVSRTRFATVILGAFAVVALALCAIGIYGVLSYAVKQRAQEIGVRIALGAEPTRIVSHFLRSGLRIVASGLVIGLAGAAVAARLQSSLLFGVSAYDPLTYVAVSVTLTLVALVAVLVPACRASRLDPTRALRKD